MSDVKDLEKEFDKNEDWNIDISEIEEFAKDEEKIKWLWESLSQWLSIEISQELEDALKILCEQIITNENITEDQEKLLNYFKENYWDKYPELKIQVELIQKYQKLDSISKNKINQLLNISNISSINIMDKINDYLTWDIDVSTTDKILCINILNNLIENLDWNLIKLEELKQKINKITIKMVEDVNKKYASEWNNNNYTKQQIMLIQLWANIYHNANLNINWIRWEIRRNIENTNKWDTNYYIWRLEIQTRQNVIDIRHNTRSQATDNLLNIPDLDDVIWMIESKDIQDKILHQFFNDIFLPVRTSWIYFENKITWEKMEEILKNMIYAEYYKDYPVKSEIDNLEYITNRFPEWSYAYQENTQMIQELQKYNTLWEYYSSKAENLRKELERSHFINLENNDRIYLNAEINEIIQNMNNLPQLSENPTKQQIEEYKKNYKKIADKFIQLRKNPKYQASLMNHPLSNQIFIDIYCIWNDNIETEFWTDIYTACKDYINQIQSLSETENKENERILDAYFEAKFPRWDRKERHYNTTEVIYWTPRESTLIVSPIPWVTNDNNYQRTIITHHDDYTWIWYSETHTTTLEDVTQPRWTRRIRQTRNSDIIAWDTIVPPDPNWWYAILPQELKDKSNRWEITLMIKDNKPCFYEFTKWWDIKIRIYNEQKKTFEFESTITQEEYNRAMLIESNRMRIWEAEHWEEFKRIQIELDEILNENEKVTNLFKEFENQELSGSELERLQRWSIKLYQLIKWFATEQTRSKLNTLKSALQKLNQNSNSYENPYEKQISDYIENIDKILSFATDQQVKQAEEFMKLCTNTAYVHENDDWYDKTRQERVTIAVSFIAAIGATIFAIYTLWLWSGLAAWWRAGFAAALWIWAISTGTAMVFGEFTQRGLNARSWWWSIQIDWKTYHLSYDNPTLLQQANDPNSGVTRWDCVKWYGTQFITWTVLQAFLMRAWSEASQFISKMVAKSPAWSFARRSQDLICKVLCKDFWMRWDPYTEWIINSVWKQASKEWFMKEFWHELIEEAREEGVEQAAEAQWALLWAIATIIHCLKPHPGQTLQLAWVWNPNINIPEWSKKLIIETTYENQKI